MDDHQLRVYNLPHEVAEQELSESVVIVIDLLRASSTICQAVASGANGVVPCLEVQDALAVAESVGRSSVILGGEREGGKIPGFDLGNSPCEYTSEAVRGRTLVITTTNGTRALYHARKAKRVLVGSFLNLSAVVASVQNERHVDVLCAGTGGEPTREDTLAAGAIVHYLCQLPSSHWSLSESAAMAGGDWRLLPTKARLAGRSLNEHLAIELENTQGGRNLLAIGLNRDLVDCAQIDGLTVVPQLNVPQWRITA
jgi:2-phosphosulfolactate phosphatase